MLTHRSLLPAQKLSVHGFAAGQLHGAFECGREGDLRGAGELVGDLEHELESLRLAVDHKDADGFAAFTNAKVPSFKAAFHKRMAGISVRSCS